MTKSTIIHMHHEHILISLHSLRKILLFFFFSPRLPSSLVQ